MNRKGRRHLTSQKRQPIPEAVRIAMEQRQRDAQQQVLFEQQDVEHALRVYDNAAAKGDRRAAMLEVMMFSLRVAAVNLGVH